MVKFILPLLFTIILFSCQPTQQAEWDNSQSKVMYASNENEISGENIARKKAGSTLGKIYPTDESEGDPTFHSFKERLLGAIEKKDTFFIKSIVAEDALGSYGGERSKKAFIEEYFGEKSHRITLNFWDLMRDILKDGGKFKKVGNDYYFVAPYSAVNLLETADSVDYFSCMVANKPQVFVYERATTKSKVIDTLNYDMVYTEYERSQGSWMYVRSQNPGYVPQKDLNNPTGFRCFFARHEGRWYIKYLVSGY
jgi:hypothetical protein